MSDWPDDQLPLFLSTFSSYGPLPVIRLAQGSTQAVSITWSANRAVYMPMIIPWEYPVKRVWWCNGSVIGNNVDFGIYSPSGARLYSTGSTAQVGTSVPQYVTPSVPFVLPAGMYYFAYACDTSNANRAFGNVVTTAANGAVGGLLSQASAFALPATATFATYGTPGLELCGITRTESGY
jgi:hypothetical protein